MIFRITSRRLRFLLVLPFLASFFFVSLGESQENNAKLYWFIPDGMRSDPDLFRVFEWAQKGKLPNIKKMMEKGSYGYSIPTFPSHTPTNFATLFTGTYPVKHGVADGPMHTEGNPLSRVSVGGFNSAAKKNDPIWTTMEKTYDQNVVLLSIPGSTPPELEKGITIRGRWGGWGADFHATIFEDEQSNEMKIKQGRGARLFFFGPPLVKYQQVEELSENDISINSFSKVKKSDLSQYGKTVRAYIYDSTDNEIQDYDRVAFSLDKIKINADLRKGEWSDWIPVILTWKVNEKAIPVKTSLKIKVIKLESNGFFRIRIFYGNLNKYLTKPSFVADEIIEHAGPMVDFVDNFPPQLIYYDEDKDAFIEEAHMSLGWHKNAVSFILDAYDPDIFINDIYTPNQMLTSRWWMGYIDPKSARYGDVTEEVRSELWGEVKEVYKKLDDIVGELLKRADQNTYVIL